MCRCEHVYLFRATRSSGNGRQSHRITTSRASPQAIFAELCKSGTEKEAGSCLPQPHQAGSPSFCTRSWCRETMAQKCHAEGFLGTPQCLSAHVSDICKTPWSCLGYFCFSRKLQVQWLWHLLGGTFLITFKQESLVVNRKVKLEA